MNLWGRLGISVAFASFFSILMTEALQTTAYYEHFKWHLCIGLFVVGVLLFIIGYFVNARWKAAHLARRRESEDPNELPDDPFLLFNLAYWGVLLIVFSVITVFIIPRPKIIVAATVAAPPPVKTNRPAPAVVPVVVTNAPPAPRAFPKLVLQGVTYAKQNSTVLINGRTLRVGDRIMEASVVEIGLMGATLEFDGQFKAFTLGK